ncbi:MAG: hypothetical protein HC918_08550 [Oscillatoriales cyanobacterium SM2_1_8]|nr:hypothetical protein [Oscillatoriales cyanobacterium SM2_1_8]
MQNSYINRFPVQLSRRIQVGVAFCGQTAAFTLLPRKMGQSTEQAPWKTSKKKPEKRRPNNGAKPSITRKTSWSGLPKKLADSPSPVAEEAREATAQQRLQAEHQAENLLERAEEQVHS